jgi:hypothetical protein
MTHDQAWNRKLVFAEGAYKGIFLSILGHYYPPTANDIRANELKMEHCRKLAFVKGPARARLSAAESRV